MDNGFSSDMQAGSAVMSCPLKDPPVHWVAIELVGEDDKPIPWAEYRIQLPDQSLVNGFLDGDGYTRLDGIKEGGTCGICFPELDQDAWTFIESTGK